VVEIPDLPCLLRPSNGDHLLLRTLGGHDGQVPGQQVIPGITVLNLYEITGSAELGDVSGENDLHLISSSS
jgi:hypothetical protein